MRRPSLKLLRAETLAGLPGAIGSVPDGMAAAVLTGVNPIHGLYASFAGPIAGGLTSSTRMMVIATTGAAALAAGDTVRSIDPADRPEALFLLTCIAGVLMIGAGLAGLGRFTRFVSHSVMLGFLTGVAFNIIFGQIPDLTGVDAEGATSIQKAFDVLSEPGAIDPQALATGLAAIAIVAILARTKLSMVGALLAIVLPTVGAAALGWDLFTVSDTGEIPTGIPLPALPSFDMLSVDLLIGAISIAVIVLVQGSGVAETAPNPDGSPSDANRDFTAQGVANVASGLFRGQPVGGSVGQTALNLASGARDRWAAVASGVWMLLILVFLSGVVGLVAMPTLAGLLIFASAASLRAGDLRAVWRTGASSRVALVTTFVATLMLPIAAAVGIGVALSLLLQLNREAMDLRVVELVPSQGGLEERPARPRLDPGTVMLLDVYGSLLYAGSKTLEARLPDPAGAGRSAVVIRLRGRATLGATFFAVIAGYADKLASEGGRLYLSGVAPAIRAQMTGSGALPALENLRIYEATPTITESSLEAFEDATDWLAAGD